MRKSYSTNENLQQLIIELRKTASIEKKNLWKRIAADLSRSTRQRRVVNISRINRHTKENDIIIVPGKVLSAGDINHKVDVAAFDFSETAREKIEKSNGKTFTITELMKSNPKAKGIRIIG